MKFVSNRETFANIATLYYMGELSQNEIADIYGISRYKVSRILKKCRELNLVEIRINNKPTYFKNMESTICELLELEKVFIAPSGVTLEESKRNVGKIAAQYLEDNLTDGMKIGFSWGSTIQSIVREYTPQKTCHNATFVQLTGSICSRFISNDGYMDGCDIVQTLAKKASATWSSFQVPYIVQSPILHKLLLQEPIIKRHYKLFHELDMAIIGVGSNIPSRSVSYMAGYISIEESKHLIDTGLIPDISGERTNTEGEIIPHLLTDRVLSIPLKLLRNTPDVIAIAAGADKVNSLIGGARGKFYSKLIIDEIAALSIINFFTEA